MVAVIRVPILHVILIAAAALATLASGVPAFAQPQPEFRPERPLIVVPGLLGSRLCRPDPANPKETQVVWGTLASLRQFPTIRLQHDKDGKDDIVPCGILREVVYLGLYSQNVYAPILRHLEQTGYQPDRNLFVFAYDWRRSVFDNAEALERFVRDKVPDGKVDILAHSLGALVARVYVMERGGSERVARLFSAGAPFQGSVKVFQTVQKGWGPLNSVMGGLDGFRRTILSFPSVFELMPRYSQCCDGAGNAFDPARAEIWNGLHWEGVEPAIMPDLAVTFERIRRLEKMITTPMPSNVEDVLLVGVDQRTPLRAGFNGNGKTIELKVQTTWSGDGTVIRDSASLERVPLYPTSFANHQNILSDRYIQEFLKVALLKGVKQAVASVPVYPRGKVKMADGAITELVGVVVEPDEPIYRTGDICKVRVHLRLGDVARVDPKTVRLSRVMPDGSEAVIRLEPDPASSDPANPFEQSFVGTFEAGLKPGKGMLKAVLEIEGDKPRIVEQPVPVIAR
jgi:pimeloyl-ACP methyl ester carboxylesterase